MAGKVLDRFVNLDSIADGFFRDAVVDHFRRIGKYSTNGLSRSTFGVVFIGMKLYRKLTHPRELPTLSEDVRRFYDDLAADYHHVYAEWESAIERQSCVLDRLIQRESTVSASVVLDCSCGIGTQAIGLARQGYEVFASDLSPKAIARAKSEAADRGLKIEFAVSDVREVERAFARKFDVVISCDNSLPHLLTDEDLTFALRSIRCTLTTDGLFVASIRDYDRLLAEKPSFEGANAQGASEREVITFQVWDWSKKSDTYLIRFFIMTRAANAWQVRELRTRYRAIRRKELTLALESAGFSKIAWHTPEQSGYFQPVVTAHA